MFTKLNDHFTIDEWDFLDNLNDAVNGHLHRPLYPGDNVKYIILPSDFSGNDKYLKELQKRQMLCLMHHI